MKATEQVTTLKINDREISAQADESILDVALENGIEIPTLCHLEGLSEVGACRLCLVEIKGSPKLQPACVTRVREGMEVYTHSERLDRYRRHILELFFTERNHICSVCVANGRCELQALARRLGMDHVHYPYLYPKVGVDASHPLFALDQNRCVLCTRCVRVCAEVEGAHTWDIRNSGVNSRVVIDFNEAWGDSETCTSCGKCVNVCPTGALFKKGKSVGEMSKRIDFLPYIEAMRKEKI